MRLKVLMAAASVLLLVPFNGCAGWKKIATVPADSVYVIPPRFLQIETIDRKWIVLSDANVVGDSLIGRFESIEPPFESPVKHGARYAIAVNWIKHAETVKRTKNHPWLAALAVVALVVVVLAVSFETPNPNEM